MALVIIPGWTIEQVGEWLRGLDDVLLPYAHFFFNHNITGRRLLALTRYDLQTFGIHKVGHQELILEAVELLTTLHFGLEAENVQTICVQLECRSRSLLNVLKSRRHDSTTPPGDLSTEILSDICYSLAAAKNLITWLDRSPFDASEEYVNNRNVIVKLGVELTSTAQRDTITKDDEEKIMKVCEKLCDLCQRLVQECCDPLFIQPASLELATIKKKPDEELGMHIQSSYCGTHVIGGVKGQSPADICGKVEEGDEVIQVNYQTVVGWQLKKLVNVLKENPKEVILMLKKRPRHINFNAHLNKRKAAANKNKQGTFPRSQRRRSQETVKEVPRVPLEEIISPPSPPASDKDNYSPGSPRDNDEGDEVFRSGSESPNINVDFDKHRRATVSGASPTNSRPSILMHDLWEERPKSHIVFSPEPVRPILARENKAKSYAYGDVKSASQSSDSSKDPLQPRSLELCSRSSNLSTGSEPCLPDVEKNQPTLLKVTKKESMKISDMKKHRLGIQHPANGDKGKDGKNVSPRATDTDESPAVHRRPKKGKRSMRNVSCLDLGIGQCEGWLFKRKHRKIFSDKWDKLWCKLVDDKIYMYKQQTDLVADCSFDVKVFKIAPYQTKDKKKFGFKAFNDESNTEVYFATETESDRAKWMNKLQLVAIGYKPQEGEVTAGFHKPGHISEASDEEEDAVSISSDCPANNNKTQDLKLSDGSQRMTEAEFKEAQKQVTLRRRKPRIKGENIEEMFKSLHQAKMSVLGENLSDRRKTVLSQYSSKISKRKELCIKLQTLQRTLKAKECELREVEEILSNATKANINTFKEHHVQTLKRNKPNLYGSDQKEEEDSSSGEEDLDITPDSIHDTSIEEPHEDNLKEKSPSPEHTDL